MMPGRWVLISGFSAGYSGLGGAGCAVGSALGQMSVVIMLCGNAAQLSGLPLFLMGQVKVKQAPRG